MSHGGLFVVLGLIVLAGEFAVGYFALLIVGRSTSVMSHGPPASELAVVQQEIAWLTLLSTAASAPASAPTQDVELTARLQDLKVREGKLLQVIAAASAPVVSRPTASNAPLKP